MDIGEMVKTIVIAYEFVGMATIVLFVKTLDVASGMIGEGEISDMNNQLKRFLRGLTPIKKIMWFILASLVWLPAVIVVLIKLSVNDSD